MTAGLSNWWATPARVDRHFSEAELRRSQNYHRQLRLVGLWASAAKLAMLAAAAQFGTWVSGRVEDGDSAAALVDGGFDERWYLETGWIGGLFSFRVLLGAGLTVLALQIPAVVSDAWFEFRFRRGRADYIPVPRAGFLATVSVLTAAAFVALVVVAGTGYRLVATRDDWAAIFVAAAVAVLSAAAVWERWLRQLLPSGERMVDADSALASELESVAGRFGLVGLRFATVANGVQGVTAAERGPNAYSAGIASNRRVVLNEALVDQDRRIRDFVVAHELTHLRRHHVVLQSVAAATAWILAVGVLAVSTSTVIPWAALGLDPLDPAGLPMVVLLLGATLVVLSPVLSWLSRGHERAADTGAIVAMGPLPTAVARDLYVATTVDLDPPLWARLYASHPAPAERLEFLARSRASHVDQPAVG